MGDTVRRPQRAASPFVHRVLLHLEQVGFDRAPRFLGVDAAGREILSFVEGDTLPDIQPDHPAEVLVAAAQLIRRYHDAVARPPLAGSEEVVCHNDLSPCNFAFRDGLPWGIFDFDGASPGARERDLGYAVFLWVNIGTDGPPVAEQARRARLMLDAYGFDEPTPVERMLELTAAKRDWRHEGADGWWARQHEWLLANGDELRRR